MKRSTHRSGAQCRLAARLVGMSLAAFAATAGAVLKAEYGPVEARLTGRVMYDTRLYSTDSDATDSLNLRRARLGVKAQFGDDWRFRVSADFPNGDFDLRDLRLDYLGFKPAYFMLGRMQEPFGLSATDSSNNLRLMERPVATGLGADYNFGLAMNTRGKLWGLTAGMFGPAIDARAVVRPTDDSPREFDKAFTARLTGTPLRGRQLLHVGVSVSRRDPEQNRVLVGNPPESGSSAESVLFRDQVSINAPTAMNVASVMLYGLEIALRDGPRMLEAEYIRSELDRQGGGPDLSFDGYYLQGSWVLTGERRGYSTRRGAFSGIRPRHQYGAWEVALRYGELDLRDEDIPGDKGEIAAVGLNWYPINHVRFMLNGVHVREDRAAGGADSESIVQLRSQLSF